MSRARHKKRTSGAVAPVRISGHPHVFDEADERKKGGKVRRKTTRVAIEMAGGAVRQRLDRPRRGTRRGRAFADGGTVGKPQKFWDEALDAAMALSDPGPAPASFAERWPVPPTDYEKFPLSNRIEDRRPVGPQDKDLLYHAKDFFLGNPALGAAYQYLYDRRDPTMTPLHTPIATGMAEELGGNELTGVTGPGPWTGTLAHARTLGRDVPMGSPASRPTRDFLSMSPFEMRQFQRGETPGSRSWRDWLESRAKGGRVGEQRRKSGVAR